jgi:hypothetical protein
MRVSSCFTLLVVYCYHSAQMSCIRNKIYTMILVSTYIYTLTCTHVALCFIGFINVLLSTEYKTCQKHTIYHKTTQRQQGKIYIVQSIILWTGRIVTVLCTVVIRRATRWCRVHSSLVLARSSCVHLVYSERKSLL